MDHVIECQLFYNEFADWSFIFTGLWQVCFNGFEEVHHWYDVSFKGCWWIFEEEYYIIHDILLPGFFIATQFFFTVSMCCVLISLVLSFSYIRKDHDDDNYVTLLVTFGTILVIGGKFKYLMVFKYTYFESISI